MTGRRLGIVLAGFAGLAGCRPPAPTAPPPAPARSAPSVEDVAWLVGEWVAQSPEGTIGESWAPPTDGAMFGQGTAEADGNVVVTEVLRIEAGPQSLVYIATPNGAEPTTFKATEVRQDHARFENPDHDDPKLIDYQRRGDTLEVKIDGDGGPRGWTLQRRVPPEEANLRRYPARARQTQLAGMGVLTGWAVTNIGTGVAGALTAEGVTAHVHEMNAMWNSVNLTLGIVGLVTSHRPAKPVKNRAEAWARYRKTRTTYAINNALDVVYIAGGVVLAELGRQRGVPRVQGYGQSIALQGAFLFAFDLTMLLAHERAARGWLRG